MIWAQYLQADCDYLNLKQRIVSLNLLLDTMVDLHFLSHSELFSIVINHHSEDVAEFEDEDKLLDEDLAHFEKDLLEKFMVVVQLEGQHELWLELHPYWM